MGVELDDPFSNPREQGEITADVGLHVEAGDLCAEEQRAQITGHAEIDEARFHNRVDNDDLAPAPAYFHESAHQPGMIARRIASDDEHQIGRVEVFEHDRGCAAAGAAGETHAAGLVAVKTTIVHIVRAIEPGEHLQQEPRLVAAAATEVPKGFVGGEFTQLAADALERILPRDRLVATELRCIEQRLRQPATVF